MPNFNYKEQSYIMLKPDGVQRGLLGEVIQRFEKRGYRLAALKMMRPGKELLETHYKDLKDLPFFPDLITYMLSGPVVCMVWEGYEVVKIGRMMLGATKPIDSLPGTIRGDFCQVTGRNIIHGSDAVESAQREINLWFTPQEVLEYTSCSAEWVQE